MSDGMPQGWMDAETTKMHARRGVWAFRYPSDRDAQNVNIYSDVATMRRHVEPGESWRWVGPHPDDEPAEPVGMVEIEAWCVVREDGRVFVCDTLRLANDFADGTRGAGASAKVVRLVGRTTLPAQDAVETVVGVARE